MAELTIIVLVLIVGLCGADYNCICSYDVEKPVYSSSTRSSQVIGYLYEFDCKPYLSTDSADSKIWGPIAFEKQLGFIELDQQTTQQICPGDPSVTDALTTPEPSTSTTLKTTPLMKPTQTNTAVNVNATTTVTTFGISNFSSEETSTVTAPLTMPVTSSTVTSNKSLPSSNLTTYHATITTSIPTFSTETKSTETFTPSTEKLALLQTTSFKTIAALTANATVSELNTTALPISTMKQSTLTTPVLTTEKHLTSRSSPILITNLSSSSMPTRSNRTTQQQSTPTTIMSVTPTSTTSLNSKSTKNQSTEKQTAMANVTTTMSTFTSSVSSLASTPSVKPSTTSLSTILTASTSVATSSTSVPSSASTSTLRISSTKGITSSASSTMKVSTPGLTGDISLCPTTQVQFAQKYGDILAQFGNNCYTVVNQQVAWQHAENICQSHGGHLLHIANKNENDFIYNLLHAKFSHAVWMGLHDTDREEHFKWTSGDPVTYTHWLSDRKNNHDTHFIEDCVEFIPYRNHGAWDDIPCGYYKDDDYDESEGYTKSFICQHKITFKPTVVSTVQTVKPSISSAVTPMISLPDSSGLTGNTAVCPQLQRYYAQTHGDILAQYKDSCYTVIDVKVSWKDAENICQRHGGHLFHISSQDENDFIYNLLDDQFSHTVWMGLYDLDREEHFKWISGDPVTYTHWLPGRKGNHDSHTVEDCVEFIPYRNHGAWDDIPCGEDDRFIKPFICQHAILNPGHVTQTVIPANTGPCSLTIQNVAKQQGGILASAGGSCYALVPRDLTWIEAEQGCNSYGGHLVQINDRQEQDFILKFVQSYDPTDAVWIGLHDQKQEGTFIWTSNQPVSYVNWAPAHFNNQVNDDVEDCVVLVPYSNGLWDDVACGDSMLGKSGFKPHHFICEFGTAHSGSGGGPILIGK